MEFASRITFTGRSRRWGGGVAFLEHRIVDGDTPGALGRRYLITREQFEDVVAQENHRATVPLEINSLTPGVLRVTGSGWYDALVAMEPVEGVPVITFTSSQPPELESESPPTITYLQTIASGLHQVHDLSWEQLVTRLRISDVVSDTWTHDELLAALTAR